MRTSATVVFLGTLALGSAASGQNVLFDFENAPVHTSLPIDLTVSGITAHFTATGQGMSIQPANTLGFTPVGFSGLCIYPNSVFAADLDVSFTKTLTNFSILFATQELDCDCSSTMKVSAYKDGVLVGSSTASGPPNYVWPSATLSFASAQGFNSVVVHYQSPPPCGCDYGVIFMADNMNVTPKPAPSGDINGDGIVNAVDLGLLLGAWGTANPSADLNGDGFVNASDLGILLGAWTV